MALLEDTFDDSALGHDDFKVLLEDHLVTLSAKENIKETLDVVPIDAHRFEYDYFGLLRYLNIQPRYHWITMRVNGLTTPSDYRSNMLIVKIPDYTAIENLYAYFATVLKRSSNN